MPARVQVIHPQDCLPDVASGPMQRQAAPVVVVVSRSSQDNVTINVPYPAGWSGGLAGPPRA